MADVALPEPVEGLGGRGGLLMMAWVARKGGAGRRQWCCRGLWRRGGRGDGEAGREGRDGDGEVGGFVGFGGDGEVVGG